ncbi:hypothetical protein JI59_14815 [Novosphingobium pentaromativorans US6-1]|uniref:DUF4261 domain-containing protein n=2 Tax=Novosphingobium pentaromativorans TaxID=205844 RepID=G6E9N8_9SPHN|nr:hypothetical protein JI59_14815 [Novosphingobium pentaromativorans US6-1]EHJ61962.1 hypothetical protein NSU_1059 [Novosphingobium pentaromativorans US6-1]
MMVTVILGARPSLPAGELRTQLMRAAPRFGWTCGDHDDGSAHCSTSFGREVLLIGRSAGEVVIVPLRQLDDESIPGAPRRGCAIVIGTPTSEDQALCEQIACAVALALAGTEPETAVARFGEGMPWLDAEEIACLDRKVHDGQTIAAALAAPATPCQTACTGDAHAAAGSVDLAELPYDDLLPHQRSERLGFDIVGLAEIEAGIAEAMSDDPSEHLARLLDQSLPPPFFRELPRRDRLPTIVPLFAAHRLDIDWDMLAEGLASIDDEGEWQVAAQGPDRGRITGRGCAISISHAPAPLPAWMVERALYRSFWCEPGEGLRNLRRHAGHAVIACDLDTEVGEFVDIRQSAKVMAMVLAVVAQGALAQEAFCGVYLPAHSCAYTAGDLPALVSPLANDEVPMRLFLWTAFHSTEADAVSLSTAGMLPFVGREVEAWNAPGTLDFVAEKLNEVMRYLLIEGPVIRHGDTFGDDVGDLSVRIWHDESAEPSRQNPVPVLLMELAGPPVSSVPHPDPVPGTWPATILHSRQPPIGFAAQRRVPGGFGRKGL